MRYGSSCLGMYVAMYDELRKHGTRLVLIACCLAILSIGENSTAIMAALPAMASSLRMRPATVEWAVNAYLLASAVFIIMGGEVADLFGARRSSAAGCVLFALASLMMVVAPNGIVVVAHARCRGWARPLLSQERLPRRHRLSPRQNVPRRSAPGPAFCCSASASGR